ncbi:MAG: PAS domain S-box protein, partial [Anaerolineales bacterium]|nr:PAS domain S-box protein [Anaerolineales bacterium]
TIAGYARLTDVYDQPALILRVEMPRNIYQQGRSILAYSTLFLLATGIVLGVATYLGLERDILARLARLSENVQRIGVLGTSARHIPVSGNDELTALEREINRMLDALQVSEERFRALVEHSSDLILILNRDTTIRYASPSVRTILGYGMDQTHGRSVLEFIYPNDHAAAQEAFAHRLSRSGASDELMTVRAQHRDGSLRTIELIGSNLLDNPAVAGIVINCHDITEREHANTALRESEEKYRQLVKYAPTGIYQVNFTERKFIDVNDVMCQYTGYTREEFLALDPLDILTEESRGLFVERWIKVMSGAPVPETVEFKAQGKNGQAFWVLLNVRHSMEPGQPVIATVIAHNITERKHAEEALRESEERYRDLVERSHAFICTHDLQGRFLSANQWAMQLLGYENFPAEPMNLRDLLAPEARAQADDYLARVQRDGFAEGLMLVQTRSGEKRLWEYHNTLRTEGVAEPIVRGIAHDITEQKKLERALRESEERWRAYIQEANDFVVALDAGGRITLINDVACNALGYRSEELIGQSPLVF